MRCAAVPYDIIGSFSAGALGSSAPHSIHVCVNCMMRLSLCLSLAVSLAQLESLLIGPDGAAVVGVGSGTRSSQLAATFQLTALTLLTMELLNYLD